MRVNSGPWRGEARFIYGMSKDTEAGYHAQLDLRRVFDIGGGLIGEMQGGLKLIVVDGKLMVGFNAVGTD